MDTLFAHGLTIAEQVILNALFYSPILFGLGCLYIALLFPSRRRKLLLTLAFVGFLPGILWVYVRIADFMHW